jgi:hypothetical protein
MAGESRLLDSRTQIKNAVIPICLDSDAKLVAVVRARHIFSDYQRRGFFRIGVLPLLVIDGLDVEIRQPSRSMEALGAVHSKIIFKELARKAVEGRDFRLSFAAEGILGTGAGANVLTPHSAPLAVEARGRREEGAGGEFILRAQMVRLESSAQWRLQDGVVRPRGADPVNFRYATLQISGANAGEISCETTNGMVQMKLLSRP